MNQAGFGQMRLGANRFTGWGPAVRWCFGGVFLLQFGLAYARLWQPSFLVGDARWPEGLLLVLAAATTLASLTRQLPAQNMMLAASIIVVVGGAAHTLGALTGIPFGPYSYTQKIGQKLFEPLPWAMPVLWLVVILNARGVARLVLRPWRRARNYGFYVLGLSVALVVLFDLSLEPFATQVKEYWTWHVTKLHLDWYSAPYVNFLGWGLTAGLILAFAIPALINKFPGKFPPDYQPLAVWVLVNSFLATGLALHQLWPAFWLTAAGTLVTGVLAMCAPRW